MLTPDAIAAANPGPLGRNVTVVPSTTSTNSDLLAEARRGAPQGRVIVAETQTGGRGRLGRSWHSPPGKNLYASILLRPVGASAAELPPLALVAGLAVKEALEAAGELQAGAAQVKWPNDVLLAGRKVAGILAEATDRAPVALVLGIGVNVNQTEFPDQLADIATSLASITGRHFERAAVLAAVLRSVDHRISQAQADIETVLAAWSECSSTLGKQVRSPDGVTGRAFGIDGSGALLLRDASGVVHPVIGGPIEEIR